MEEKDMDITEDKDMQQAAFLFVQAMNKIAKKRHIDVWERLLAFLRCNSFRCINLPSIDISYVVLYE